MNTIKKHDGFSLIEMAIVIVILGAVLTPLFAFLTTQQKNEKQREEEAVNERVLASLSLYLRQQGVFPCPADPALGPGDTDYGEADCSAGGAIVSTGGANSIIIGAIPVKDLNLPFHSAANVDGWKYIYAVTERLTDPTTFGTGLGAIQIQDSGGSPFGAANRQFVLVNPGGDGKGVRNLQGAGPGIACTGTIDTENCNNDADFVEHEYSSQGDPTDTDYYDDTISYTLAREESTFWVAEENAAAGLNGISIVNRNQGNVGIGMPSGTAPAAKLHVMGGDVRVQSDGGTGGSVTADQVNADTLIRSEGEIQAVTKITAPVFFYGTP